MISILAINFIHRRKSREEHRRPLSPKSQKKTGKTYFPTNHYTDATPTELTQTMPFSEAKEQKTKRSESRHKANTMK